MTTLLAKQVAAFKQHHGITAVGTKRQVAPSILFSPQEAKSHDPETFAALALHGLSEAAVLEPKLSQYSELFEGTMKDRDLLTKEENGAIDQKIHKLLLLLSPHLQARAAQECVEGLLYRYHAHRWNVDDLMAAALPHHDSPLFTKLVQGLHVENRPRWAWLSTLKAKPATLIRSRLAKYCSKDTAVLSFLGDILEETLQMQLENRALMTFFAAIWLDTIALSVGNDLVQVAIQSLLKLLSQPAQQDAFYAGVTVTGALCAKIQLEESVQGQLLVRLAKQAVGEDGRAAFEVMAAMSQLQELEKMPGGVVKVLAKHGPEELLRAASPSVDAGNLLAMVVKAGLGVEEENAQALVQGLLEDSSLMKHHAPQLCRAVLQAFLEGLRNAATAKARKKTVARFQAPAKCLGCAPLELNEAMRQTLSKVDKDTAETLVQLAPTCAESDGSAATQASRKSAKVRGKATAKTSVAAVVLATPEEIEGEERQRLLASLANVEASPRRRNRNGTGENREVVQRLMRLVLRKPKDLAADLQTALNQESSRAAIVALALGPHEKGVVSANALRMLKSLVSKKGWPLDQHMLPLIMVKIANAQELEVRSAAVAFLKLLKDSTVEKAAEATLVEAGLLKAKSAVLPDKAWSLVTGHLGNDLWSSLLELLLKNEKEMLQDRAATATALMKLWTPKGLKSQRQEALSFIMVSLARCEGAEKLMEALPLSALQCVKEPLCKAVAELSKKGASQAFGLLAAALKLMTQGKEKGDKGKAQETLVDVARSVVFPLCLALAKRCEAEVAWDATLVDLACDSCWVVSRLAAAHSELLEEATNSLFRFTVSLRGLVKISEDQSKMAKVVAAASTALAEVPTDVNTLMVSMLKCDVMQGKRLKEPQGVAAAQLISEQVLSLPSLPGRSKLLMALATAAKEAGKHLPKDADSGGAVVHLLLAVAAVSEQLAQDESSEEAAEAASSVPAVCQAVDEASSVCLDICFSSLIRCCGSLSVLAAEGSCALQLLQKAIRKVHLRPEALVLLKGNMRRLWRYPEADDWRIPQARLRGLLHSIFQAVEVSKTTSLAWASSSGTRASLDFTILLMLVRRARQEQPVMPKKKRRKKRSDPINEEVDEALEALTAPSSEELLLDEVFEMLTAVEPSERYHAFGIFLMDLAAWCSKMKSSELPWGALVPDEVIAELDEDMSFRVLGQGVQLASRFLLEHGLPDELDTEEVDTSVLLEMMEEKEGSIALALSHGLRSLCIIEALLTQTPGQSREEVQCRKQTQDLQGLLMRSLSVNHPATFFRALCLSLGVKGKAPKGNASTLLAEQEFVSHLSSRVMRAAAKALKDRRDIRDDDEEAEEGSATSREAIIQHVCKRFLSGDHAEMGTSWEFLDEICRFSQSSSMLSSALPKAGTFLASLATSPDEAATRAAVKCCQCVETMVFTLGHGILPKLNDITQPLLDLAQRVVQSSQSSESALDLDGQILQALGALCRSVGGVLSPFLGQFLQVVCAPASLLRTKSLEELASQLVDGVPHRLLLKEVQKATVDPFKDSEMDLEEAMIRSQRLSTFYLWILVKATPEFAASHDIMPSLLRLFGCSGSAVRAFLSTADAQEIPLRLLKREPSMELITSSHMQDLSWSNVAQDASLQRLQMLGGACFARFCLFLEPDDVKTRIAKVLDWARGKQDKLLARPKNEVRDEDASKTLALMAALTTLAVEAEGLAEELLMPLANKDISSALKASHSVALRLAREKLPRKKRRTLSGSRTDKEVLSSQSWWWYDVAMACLNFLGLAFKQGSNSGPEAKVWAESFEELLEPCVSILDVFEFLAVDDAICSGLARVLQSALVAMTASSAEDGVKRMMQAVLEKTRSEDAEVVLMALRCAHRIWSDLGIQVVMSLSEVVMYTSELQDHEDSRVETEVKAMVRTIEDCTGESLHDAMKT